MAHLVAAQHHVQHLGVFQQLGFQIHLDHVVGQQRQRGDLRPFQPVAQVILAEPRHRRHKDQDFGQHHEGRGQDQEAP